MKKTNQTITYLMLALIITSSLTLNSCKKDLDANQDVVVEEASEGGVESEKSLEDPKLQDANIEESDEKTNTDKPLVIETESSNSNQINVETTSSDKIDAQTVQLETALYKNGTYTQPTQYISPAGSEDMTIVFVVDNDLISNVTVNPGATNEISKTYQENFAVNISTVVVGKKIDGLSISKVSGASLTSAAFNSALTVLKSSAKN